MENLHDKEVNILSILQEYIDMNGQGKKEFANNISAFINKQNQELFTIGQQFDNHDFMMLQHVIDFAKMGIKAIFLLNGTAAVTVLTLFTSTSLKIQNVYEPLLNSVTYFSFGALFAVICIIFAYGAQTFFQYYSASINQQKMFKLRNNKYDEEKLFLYSELKIDNQKFIDTQIDRINACIQDNNIEISLEEKNKVKMKKIGEFFRWSCIFWVLISLFFFAIGVYEIKNGFENSLVLPVKSDTTIIKRDNSINVEGTNSIEFKK